MSEAALSSAFEDPNDAVVRSLSIKLLRRSEYQRRLNRLVQRETSDRVSRERLSQGNPRAREMLRDLSFTEPDRLLPTTTALECAVMAPPTPLAPDVAVELPSASLRAALAPWSMTACSSSRWP